MIGKISRYTMRMYLFGGFYERMDCEFYAKFPGNSQRFGYLTRLDFKCIGLTY
jgi:hypothetical protein